MTELKKIVDEFLKEFNTFNFDQIALRDPPSKHQRELKKLISQESQQIRKNDP